MTYTAADADLQESGRDVLDMVKSGKLLEIVSKYGYGKDELPTDAIPP